MNEKDSKVLQDICDYLHGERQQQNNEYLREIKGMIWFWKEDGKNTRTLHKILAELEAARSVRYSQLALLAIITFSVIKMAWG
jgi:hypothetical protein|tara:strand:- start:116 stop:364 length:249 start_codon:yes stop_codon:yes gene_type:complete